LTATPSFWSSQGKWYVNVDINDAEAYEGLMGAISRGGWLPALPDGSSLGPIPASVSDRYEVLYKKFGEAWRVTDKTSLFDYQPGTSTADFTLPNWPKDSPPCDIPSQEPAKPVDRPVAEKACAGVADKNRFENCVFDVEATGELGFAKTYLLTERLEHSATSTMVAVEVKPGGEQIGFAAAVFPRWLEAKEPPTGEVQFYLHGKEFGEPVKLDATGHALWEPRDFDWKNYRVSARYRPAMESPYLGSSSEDVALPDRSNTEVLQMK
jgi:hypothetical protein